MAIADDIAVDTSGNIYYIGELHGAAGAGYYTVLELHRYLQNLADDATASGDDLIDITSITPSDRSTDNIITIKTGYRLDDAQDTADANWAEPISEHLYDGSIIQEDDGLTYDGLVVLAAEGMDLQVQQDGAQLADDYWNSYPKSDSGATVSGNPSNSATFTASDGSLLAIGEKITVGSTTSTTEYLITNIVTNTVSVTPNITASDSDVIYNGTKGLNADAGQGISHRFIFKVKTIFSGTASAGTDTDTIVDSGQDFNKLGVKVGDIVWNTSRNARSVVTSVVSDDTINISPSITSQNASDTYQVSHQIDGKRLIGMTRVNYTHLSNLTGITTGKTYSEFKINGTANGNNVLALSYADDLNDSTDTSAYTDVYAERTTSTATVSGVNSTGQAVLNTSDGTQFTAGDFIMIAGDPHEYQIQSIAVNALTLTRNLQVATTGGEALYDLVIGYNAQDINIDTTNEYYYSKWLKGAQTINNFYTRMKYISGYDSTHYISGLPAKDFRGITHEIDVDGATGTFAPAERVTWNNVKIGEGQMLAINSPTAGTKIWIQLLKGELPADNDVITGSISSATVTAELTTGTIVERPISSPFVGVSTGSALIGAYGFALDDGDLSNADKVFDLTNTQITPPNNVTFSVGGLIQNEDRILVGPKLSGSTALDEGQFAVSTAVSSGVSTTIVIKAGTESCGTGTNMETDTPSATGGGDGYLRVKDDSGVFQSVAYDSVTFAAGTATFDLTAATANFNAAVDNDVYLAYIDKLTDATPVNGFSTEAFTVVYAADRDLFIRVRDGGATPIKTFETSGTLTDAGGTSSAIRTTDA